MTVILAAMYIVIKWSNDIVKLVFATKGMFRRLISNIPKPMLLKNLSTLLLMFIVPLTLLGANKFQEDPIKKVATQLEKWTSEYPQEKAYLHFDKPYYTAGDDIWFKAYVTVGPKHQLSALNGALNVELIDDKDSVKRAIKLPLIAGLAYGDIALSDTLLEGNYRIRAYTRWMRNAGPDYFFDKTIHIGNAINKVITKTTLTYTTQSEQQVINASINYTDLSGTPYTNKKVSYHVELNKQGVLRGSGVTDSKGDLSISFINKTRRQINEGSIIAKIRIDGKNIVTNALPVKVTSGKTDVQFFPEGGYLVNGLPCKVAFKAIGADGLGKVINGVVVDDNNREVSKIATLHLGMGKFIMAPEAGKSYQARITFEDGSQNTVALPKAQDQGYVMIVNGNIPDDTDHIAVRILASRALTGNEISLLAQSGGNVCFAAKNKMENGSLSLKIPKDRFPSGISHFTLFNAAGNAVNERIVFVNRPDGLNLAVTSSRQTYAPREKVNFQVVAQTGDDKPVMSSLSTAVIDETQVPVDESDEVTILSSMLLSSDIKGYIEKPNYYFTSNSQQTKDDLDVLMLTQGYRRFEWKQLMSDTLDPVLYQPESSLQISGTVKTYREKPVANSKVLLFNMAGGAFSIDTVTDAKGHFVFNNLVFRDSAKFVVQARTEKDKRNVDITPDSANDQIVTYNKNAPDIEVNVNNSIKSYLVNNNKLYEQEVKFGLSKHSIMLKEVVIKDKKILVPHSSNLRGAGNADFIMTSAELDKMNDPSLAFILQSRLMGVEFYRGVPYPLRRMSFTLNRPVAIFVDGMPADSAYLNDAIPSQISSIEYLRASSAGVYGVIGGGGVIVVNTKNGSEYMGPVVKPGIITYAPKGYYLARTFYSPQYDDPKTNAALADLRSTIYWNPSVITDKDGKAAIEFFNAGSKGTYRVVVEGIDNDGHIGRHVYHYKVE
jgi:hypothetical protein